MTAYYNCPFCGLENAVLYELDGYKPMEVWLDNDDDGSRCAGCRKELDESALYKAASLAAVGA